MAAAAFAGFLSDARGQDEGAQEGDVQEVIVTGSRVPRVDLESNSPLTSISAARIQVSAETNIVRQLQQLPAFSPTRSPSSGGDSGFTGSFADLRGLGRQRTLVLVNGRRWINTISDGGVDLSTIPPELVERVDIVTGGASATYGSDAVAGVVNIILKENFDGLEFNAQSGLTEEGESTNTRISLTGGRPFADGRGSAYFHASNDITREIGSEHRSYLDPVLFNEGGALVPLNSLTTGSASAIIGGEPAIFRDGDLFSAPGVLNELTPTDMFNEGQYARVQIPARKRMFATGLTYELHDRVKLYTQGIYIREENDVRRAPYPADLSGESIGIDNPFLAPDTRTYLASLDTDADGFVQIPGLARRLVELGRRAEINERDSYRLMGGFELDIGRGWKLDTSAIYSESNFQIHTEGFAGNARLSQALDVIEGPEGPECRIPDFGGQRCVPLDIFSSGAISPEAAQFITIEGGLRGNNTDTNLQSILTGKLLELPAGPMGVALGLEYRKSKASEIPNEVWRYGLSSDVLAEFSASLKQKEVFGEVVVPVIKDAPFAHYLGLELGARFTRFNPGDQAWTYKALLDWAPIRQIRLRGGVQRATRAPNPFELGGGDQAFSALEVIGGDPCFTGAPLTGDLRTACVANGVPATVADAGGSVPPGQEFHFTFFGNPDLAPEVAKTWTVGAVLNELGVEGLSFTVDYYRINIDDVITSLGTEIINQQCFFSGTGGTDPLCNEITRDPVTGIISAFDDGPVNGGGYKLSGLDLTASYTRAQLGVNVIASQLAKFVFTPFAEQPEVRFDCAGLYGPLCQFPRPEWKAATQVSWQQGPITLAMTWNWVGGTKDEARKYDVATVPELAHLKIGDKNYFDLNAVWHTTDKIELRAGVENLFDARPPIFGMDRLDAAGDNNTFPGLYDTLGRRYFAGVKVRF
jgi:outer membrane receptor protein involved in Fe transport